MSTLGLTILYSLTKRTLTRLCTTLPLLASRLYERGGPIPCKTPKIASKSTIRAFNDVTEIPNDGVWIQAFHENGTIEINTGENGLVRLDNIVKAAKDNNLHVLFSLTNNWFRNATATTSGNVKPSKRAVTEITPVDRHNLPPNYLSNDYG